MKYFFKKTFFASCLATLLSAPTVFAQNLATIPSNGPSISDTITSALQKVFDIGIGIGSVMVVTGLAMSGVFFALSSVAPSMRARAKSWFTGSITGLLIFTMFYLILSTINPDLVAFRFGKALSFPGTQTAKDSQQPGIYFYSQANCKGDPIAISTVSSAAFNTNNAVVKSMSIVNDSTNNVNYGAVAYDENSYAGACTVDRNSSCLSVSLSKINSVLVYQKPSGASGSATLYREPAFDKDGGYLDIQKEGTYQLADLAFTGTQDSKKCNVPQLEQDCVAWNVNNTCTKWQCPTLFQDISSIETDGNYLVIMEYIAGQGQPISFCQTYPPAQDVDRSGSKESKWDLINNAPAFVANTMQVIPVQK
jgi:hypothetical protein